jgi:uncharacterized protein involved in outer membrane biogenesis
MKRAVHVALGALALLAAAVSLAGGAFLWGLEVDGEFLRAPLERVLTSAFDVPTRIEGPLRLRTGRAATVSAEALVLADPMGPAGATLARGIAPSARIDLLALLRRAVLLEEVSGERLELSLSRQADGKANWAQLFSASDGSSPVSFAGIERLRIGAVAGSYRREREPPVPFVIDAFDGAVPLDEPLRASGTARIAGQAIGFDLRTASLNGLPSAAGLPLQGTLLWSGVHAAIDGKLLDAATRLEMHVEASASDAAAPLAALGIVAHDPGRLALSGQFAATARQLSARDLVVSLGESSAAGSASIAWGRSTPSVVIDLTAERVDTAPFLSPAARPKRTQAAEQWVARLGGLATDVEASVKLAADEVGGLPATLKALRFHLRSGERTLAAKVAGVVAGTPVEASVDYDAREPQHTLAARIDSGAASTASLPGEARPSEFTVTTGGIRGRLRGAGASATAIVASLQGDFDARNLDWTFARGKQPPVKGRFDVVRIALHGTKASSAEVSGKIEGVACGLKISGGAAAPLLAGEPWPVQFSANCPNERVDAKGRIALVERHATADLAFDVAGDRSGPVARALGLPAELPYPLAARGTLLLDDATALLRLAALRIGRTAGSAEVAYPLGIAGIPRLRLALTTLDLSELGAAPTPDVKPADPLERRLLPSDLRLPDADFDIAADRIVARDARLSGLRLQGSMRARRIQAAPFQLSWDGIVLRGQVGADLSGVRPRLQIDGTAHDADLRPLLSRLGVEGARVRAGQLSLSARSQGARLRELLASATLNATVDRAQVELQRPLLPGSTGRGTLAATFKAAPGQSSVFTARGEMDGRPLELGVDGPAVDALASDGAALPLTVRATLGDVSLEAEGRFARGGTGEGRVRLAGRRLDQLGDLLGLTLPEVQPYAGSANLALSPATIAFSDLNATFGRSRIAGSLRVDLREGRRALHSARMRAPVLHLEDIGAAQWTGGRGAATGQPPAGPTGQRAQEAIEHVLRLLPMADLEATIDVDELHGGGQQFASGRVQASVDGGRLRLQLQDMRTQDGSASAEARIDASAAPPRFSLRADARRVEYGALLRALDPASTLAGQLDLVVDLSTQGQPGSLLSALRGTVDLAAYPRGMKSDALGIWGAGLLPVILRQVERDSQATVECSVAGFAVGGGVARTDGFFVETTRVRVIGDLELRLGSWEISGRIDPRSNEPQLFAISPTMLVRGTLDNPSLSVAPESLVLAPLRFASPLSLFAIDWLSRKDRRADARADCREAFERTLQAHSAAAAER